MNEILKKSLFYKHFPWRPYKAWAPWGRGSAPQRLGGALGSEAGLGLGLGLDFGLDLGWISFARILAGFCFDFGLIRIWLALDLVGF